MGHHFVLNYSKVKNNMSLKVCFIVFFVATAYAAPQQLALEEEEVPFNDNPQYTYAYQEAAEDEQTYIAHQEKRDGDDVTGEYSYVDPLGNLIKVVYTAGVMGYTETRTVQPNFVQIRARPVVRTEVKPAPAPTPVVQKVVQQVAPVVQKVVEQQVETQNDGDLVARIIAQLTPFIRSTVTSSLGGSSSSSTSSANNANAGSSQTTTTTTTSRRPAPVRRVVAVQQAQPVQRTVSVPVPAVTSAGSASSSVAGIFGTGGANNVRFNAPEFNYEFDLS